MVGGRGGMDDYRLEVFAMLPWGDGPDAIPLALQDHPPFGEVSPEQMRKVRVPVRIRVDARGGVHILSVVASGRPAGAILHLDATGRLAGRTPLGLDVGSGHGETTIVDYVVDDEWSCYLLEQVRLQNPTRVRNRLRRCRATGEVLWSREGPRSDDGFDVGELRGRFARLWLDEDSRLFLPATEHAGVIAEIDRATGTVSRLHTSSVFSGAGFLGASGHVVSVLYFPETGRRGIGVFDLASHVATTHVGDLELYGWLTYPVGADAASNLYTWRESAIARVAPDGRVTVVSALDNVTVGLSGDIVYSSVFRQGNGKPGSIRVTAYDRQGYRGDAELVLPDAAGPSSGAWKLIHVDDRRHYHVFGGEQPGEAGTLLTYSDQGALREVRCPPPELLLLESGLEPPAFWDVDRRGRVYLPVLDPRGVTVIRATTERSSA